MKKGKRHIGGKGKIYMRSTIRFQFEVGEKYLIDLLFNFMLSQFYLILFYVLGFFAIKFDIMIVRYLAHIGVYVMSMFIKSDFE